MQVLKISNKVFYDLSIKIIKIARQSNKIMEATREIIKNLVANDSINDAFEELKKIVESIESKDIKDAFFLLLGRKNAEFKRFVVGTQENKIEENALREALLKFSETLFDHIELYPKPTQKGELRTKTESRVAIPTILAGCGQWARERTVLPYFKQNPAYLFEPIIVTHLKGGEREFKEVVLPAFKKLNLPAPIFASKIFQAIEHLKAKYSNLPIAVIINTPNMLHEQIAISALRDGCHVYTERPINSGNSNRMGLNDDLEYLISLAHKNKTLLYSGVQRRLEAPFKYMFNVIEKKMHFGKISNIICVLKTGRELKGWRTIPELSGGGIIVDEGYHLLDAALWMMEASFPGFQIKKNSLSNKHILFKNGEMPETKLIETTSVGCLDFPEQEVILNFNFTYNAPLDSIFEMLEIIDVFGNKIRLLRDQTKRSQVPGKILHQLRSGEIIGHGYIQFDSPDSFSFVEDPDEASKANNIGPIKQFYHHIRSLDSGLVNYDFNLSRQGSFNECEAKFVLNTQELISTIYE